MSTSLDAVMADALKLSQDDRAELIERLADTVLAASPLHPAWEAEIAKRVADMDAGLTESYPAEEVMAELRAMIEAHDPKA